MLLLLFSLVLDVALCDLSFIGLGDWGATGNQQQQVADQMAKTVAQVDAQFIANIGDNFYEYGVTSVDDPQWENTFKQVYKQPQLVNVPWISTLGNHDYRPPGNPEVQIDYKKDSRWIMPKHYYSKIFKVDQHVQLQVKY